LPPEDIPWPPLAADASKDKYGLIDPLPHFPVASEQTDPG
jgi:hypothetical protein